MNTNDVPVKLDFSKQITNIAGNKLIDSEKNAIILENVLTGVLLTQPGAADPKKNWKIANKIYTHKVKEYIPTESEVAFIEDLLKRSSELQPMIKGQVLEILEDALMAATEGNKVEEKSVEPIVKA